MFPRCYMRSDMFNKNSKQNIPPNIHREMLNTYPHGKSKIVDSSTSK